ncbi:collagen-binding domain-containing protein [Chryseobacterium lacus]|uniref:collagen-binding domain-containing protein n=1 Tax=Chryseobacterium lacus TaxID=2058346 RepID=UPI000F86CBD3|nr:collagen-binding domain-containing protein [Chryseobacterium lacus]RST26021.1 choice-of-anchor A family protein [Chryseobacterium lacus]
MKSQLFLVWVLLLCGSFLRSQNPVSPALGFNVFVENNLELKSNESEGPVAAGGNLTIAGNYQVAIHNAGNFLVGGQTIGLLIGGKLVFQGNGDLKLNKGYVKIGDLTSAKVWYKDNNNANANIRITKNNGGYDNTPRISLQNNAPFFGNVSPQNNPVNEGNLIDFAAAFTQMRAASLDLSQCTHNAQLSNPNGNPVDIANLPNQIKITLQNGINYLNIKGTDLNSVSEITFVNQPNANRILVINVNAAGSFNWKVWNQPGFGGKANCPYVIYNFYNATEIKMVNGDTVEGTIFAPFADVDKNGHSSNIEGQLIAKSFKQNAGEMHYANFSASLPSCVVAPVIAPVADFSVNAAAQCLSDHSFVFTNTTTGTDPVTYHWDFGDGTISTVMNPVKSYTTPGTYTVSMTATNAAGYNTKTSTVTVYQSVTPVVNITGSVPGNGSVTKQLTLANVNIFSSFSWNLQGGGTGLFPNQSVVNFSFTEAGLYIVTVNTLDANGCAGLLEIPIIIEADDVSPGNDGGLESESLGDAVTKRYLQRKKKSLPTKLEKTDALIFNKNVLAANNGYYASQNSLAGLTMLNMFPSQLVPGSVAHVTSPTDILDYTIAEEVLSVDFSLSAKTKAVVLGVRTANKVYNHTKASCDRLRGAEILYVKTVKIKGYNFLEQAIKQRNGSVEYAISFAVGLNDTDSHYSLQTNWFVKEYIQSKDVYNFQVWATTPAYTVKLVEDILTNLNGSLPVIQTEVQKLPKTYAAKISREGINLVMKLRSVERGQSIEIEMEENHTETNGYGMRYEPLNSDGEQTISIEIKDSYEFDGLIKVNGQIQDAFYHADGNWGLDYDKQYTKIENYRVYNNFDRVYKNDEKAVHRTVNLTTKTDDYITLYKSLYPGNLPDDYSEYKFIAFTAKGSGLLDIGLVKSSVKEWKNQYKAPLNIKKYEQTYYIPFDYFKSEGNSAKMTVEDLTTLTFTFLPAKAETNMLDLVIKDVKFTKTAPEGYESLLTLMKNEYVVYPNPSNGTFNALLYSEINTFANVTIYDMTGKIQYSSKIFLNEGRNELLFENLSLPTGVLIMNITGSTVNYGSTKLMIRNK